MNIYLHVEISARELDSKILLGTLAAARGHEVLISDLESIIKGLKRKILAPGIYHTKSLTPSDSKISRHQSLIDSGSKITSIDEEGGLVDEGYEKFASSRYSDRTLSQSSAVFGWGPEDTETLKKIYPKHSSKIFMTGSPRVDLWKPFFASYWNTNNLKIPKPFLLVSSNMGAFNMMSFNEIIKFYKEAGYFERDPETLKTLFGTIGEDYKMAFSFIEAIKYLAKNNNGYDIVLRPHPTENIDTWKIFFENIPNIKVIRNDSISVWVNNAFAVMHNGCTTAIESFVSQKPVITYTPFERNFSRIIPNKIGYNVQSPQELSKVVNEIFDKGVAENIKDKIEPDLEVVDKKIYIDDEHAAKKIINVWESLGDSSLSNSNNWSKFQFALKIMKYNGIFSRAIKNLFSTSHKKKIVNYKFPNLDKSNMYKRIDKLQSLLNIEHKIKYKILSDRSIIITPK